MKRFTAKKLITVVFLTLFIFVFSVERSYAEPITFLTALGISAGLVILAKQLIPGFLVKFSAGAIYYTAVALAYLMGWIASAVFYFGGWLVDFALSINYEILKSPLIKSGAQIMLGFANLGFVLAIIIFAFATIFQLESYGSKKAFGRLVAAALLVNFSLFIAGAFIDVSHVFAKFFSDRIESQGSAIGIGGGISTQLADVMHVQTLLSLSDFLQVLDQNNASTSPTGTPFEVPTVY